MTAILLLADLRRRGVHLQVVGDKLRFKPTSALTPEQVSLLKAHKAELLTLLTGVEVSEPLPLGPDGWPADTVEPPAACPTCGGIEAWWDIRDSQHCRVCSPPRRTAAELQAVAARIGKSCSRKFF